MYRGTEGKGDAPKSSACWFYRIRAAQSAVRSPDYALRDVINFAAKFGLSYLLFQCVVFSTAIIVSQRHIEIAGRRVRISVQNSLDHVARHLGYVPHFVRHGCDKTSMRWKSARLLLLPFPDTCPNTVFPPSGTSSVMTLRTGTRNFFQFVRREIEN